MNRWQELYQEFRNEGMSDKKAAWFADTYLAREEGREEKRQYVEPAAPQLTGAQVEFIKSLGTGIHTIKSYPRLAALVIMEPYRFDGGIAQRRKVDQLDQVMVKISK